jgi:hypothetical protein
MKKKLSVYIMSDKDNLVKSVLSSESRVRAEAHKRKHTGLPASCLSPDTGILTESAD